MKVEVQLFATLAPYQPAADASGRSLIELSPAANVADALRALRVPDGMPRIVLVNGHDAEDDQRLEQGDVVSIFPPLAGGSGRGVTLLWLERNTMEASRNPVGLPDFKSGVRL